jgi:hypothetical protein
MKSTPISPRRQTYYDYRGVRFYTSITDGPETPTKEQRRHGYLCLWPTNFALFDETLEKINSALNAGHEGRGFEHVRREISQAYDSPADTWQKDAVHYLAGWDYQHYCDENEFGRGYKWDGFDDLHIVLDCERAIDSMFERGLLKERASE